MSTKTKWKLYFFYKFAAPQIIVTFSPWAVHTKWRVIIIIIITIIIQILDLVNYTGGYDAECGLRCTALLNTKYAATHNNKQPSQSKLELQQLHAGISAHLLRIPSFTVTTDPRTDL